MALELTDNQIGIVKGIVEYAEAFADQVFHIMQNHGLDKVDGVQLVVEINPKFSLTTKSIDFGADVDRDSGHIEVTKGRNEKQYVPTGKNSTEYQLLFVPEDLRRRMEAILKGEKPFPPDGLWVGDNRNDSPMGVGEWDVNDSLS